MSLGDVIFTAKLDTKQFNRDVARIEKRKIQNPLDFGKMKMDAKFFTAGMKASAQQMKAAQKEALGYKKTYEDLVRIGNEFKETMNSMIGGPTINQQEAWEKLSQKIQQAKSDMEEASNYMKHAERGQAFKGFLGNAFQRLKDFGSRLLGLIPKFKLVGRSARGAGSSISHGMGEGLKRILGMAGAGALLYKTFQYAKEGMSNLIAYDKNTANSVNMLKGALTSLKNALASAFAPIISVIAPILTKFINMLVTAANAVASFISALTGKKFAVVADSVSGGFDGIGSSAGGANDSAKELQRTLMGFDKINKLDSTSGSGGSGSGGSGGGAGGGGFDIVPVSDAVNEWADKFKESWETADFEWLGTLLAQKLNNALKKIPWDDIKKTARKIAKSIATFLNGFFGEEALWARVGNTLAEALNTVIEFAYTFVTEFDWKKFGKAISNAINGFVSTVDTAKAAKTLSEGIKGILDTVIGVLNETDWSQIGTKIGEFLVNVDWKGVAKKIGEAIVAAFKAIANVFEGIGLVILQAIQDWLAKKGIKIDLVGNVNKVQPDPKLNNTLNTTANFNKREVDKNKFSTIFDTTGNFTTRKRDKKKFSLTYGLTGNFQERIRDKNKFSLTYGLTGNFNNRTRDKSFSTTFDSTAKFTDVRDSLKAAQKTLSATANITSITVSQHALTQLNNKIKGNYSYDYTAEGGIFKNGKKYPITRYASGGLARGSQLFWAREKGPELVGTLGGHTAVMNNDQIVASVSSGVAKAIAGIRFKMSAPPLAMTCRNVESSQVFESDNKDVVALLTQILVAINNKQFNVELDGEQIKNNVVRRINNHTRATGRLEIVM